MRLSWKSGCILLALVFGGAIGTVLFQQTHSFHGAPNSEQILPVKTLPKKKEYFSYIDGRLLPKKTEEFAIGVMIDNSVPARKGQEGIEQAPLVFEALAEGGVTRFLAVFSSRQDIHKIGPIRSARPYFLDFLKPLHGIFVHAGGSDEVLAELSVSPEVLNLDHNHEWAESTTFWRDDDIARPHNLFSSLENLKDRGKDAEEIQNLSENVFSFANASLAQEAVSGFTIDFPTEEYDSSWIWNESDEKFFRRQDGSLLKIVAENVVILEVPMWAIPGDEKFRMEMENVGSGDLHIFQGGKVMNGIWKKDSRSEPYRFFSINGKELPFFRGQTWIIVVDDLNRISTEMIPVVEEIQNPE